MLNGLFTVGAIFGAINSKYILDCFGRKKSLLLFNLSSMIGAFFSILAFYLHSPICLMINRFFMAFAQALRAVWFRHFWMRSLQQICAVELDCFSP